MAVHPLAGKPVPPSMLADIARLVTAYYTKGPEPGNREQKVAFGTSGHRGSSLRGSFNEAHILAITQAICDFRLSRGIAGPLFLGMDTHALSEPSHATAVEVLAANRVDVFLQEGPGYTPTPVISHAILTHNRRSSHRADGIVITPSHNPPEDGGFKYNPPEGGPAPAETTRWIEERANGFLEAGNGGVKRIPYEKALRGSNVHRHDYVGPYVKDLENVLDMEAVRSSGVRVAADPMGGSTLPFWEPIAGTYGLDITVVNDAVDPTFRFMTVDHDGKIRMDCSSPWAMARLIDLAGKYDIAFGNDPDGDRHGIVCRHSGLMNPNHYLAVAIWYLFRHRPLWGREVAVGKTLVSSSMIDRVASRLGRKLVEVPVGFKWFVDDLLAGRFGFSGEESAGASFLRRDGTVWTTDKDGILMALLAAEILAATGRDPGEHYAELVKNFGDPLYERQDRPATAAERELLSSLSPGDVTEDTLAGEPILARLTKAPGNGASIGGLKVVSENGWFAARPSGTEDIYKIYAESFRGEGHLRNIQEEAGKIIGNALRKGGS